VGYDWLSSSGVLGWKVKVAADLNGDSTPDLIWQNETTREVVAWYMGGVGGTTYQGLGWLPPALSRAGLWSWRQM
jgi:hypothetical protein